MQSTVANFSKGVFEDLGTVYESIGIKPKDQIKEFDITAFADIDSPDAMRFRVENIKEKLLKIRSQIEAYQAGILKKYQNEVKELLSRKAEEKEKQLKVLKFMQNSGFDLIPKDITDKIIRQFQSNMLTIPGLEISPKNIDLKNGHFGESAVFISKEN